MRIVMMYVCNVVMNNLRIVKVMLNVKVLMLSKLSGLLFVSMVKKKKFVVKK